MFAREKPRDRGQHRKESGTQSHPGNPSGAAVFRALVHVFVQMLKGNFRFFHAFQSMIANRLFKVE